MTTIVKRMKPKDRSAAILDAAITVTTRAGINGMRLQLVADEAECSTALVMIYYSTMTKLRRAVMRAAISRELLPVIANGVVNQDPTALKADPVLRRKALASLTQ